MAFTGLSVPTIVLNNVARRIKPNSLMYDLGEGEVTVRSLSGGGNEIVTVHTPNAETKIGRVNFALYVIVDIDSLIADLKERIAANNVGIIQRNQDGSSITISFSGLSVTNMVDRNAAHDGDIAIEMAGDPGLIS